MKRRLKVGDRVTVFDIRSVTWPGSDDGVGLSGVVTLIGSDNFYFLPDEPDESRNYRAKIPARNHSENGWSVMDSDEWIFTDYIINELELEIC